MEIANWLELILLLIGLAVILVKLFILPTFGLLGFLGLLLFIVGLLGMMLPGLESVDFEYDTQTLNAAGQFLIERLAWLAGALILSIAVIAILARYVLPSFSGFKRFVLSGYEQDASQGYTAGYQSKDLPQLGAEGEVLATLRPAGKVVIQDHIYDAVSTGDFIDAGERIVVERVEGSLIVVNRLKRDEMT